MEKTQKVDLKKFDKLQKSVRVLKKEKKAFETMLEVREGEIEVLK